MRRYPLDSADCTGKVGIIGFCMGGAFALVMSTRGFDARRRTTAWCRGMRRGSGTGACPIVASYGSNDPLIGNQGPKLDVRSRRSAWNTI